MADDGGRSVAADREADGAQINHDDGKVRTPKRENLGTAVQRIERLLPKSLPAGTEGDGNRRNTSSNQSLEGYRSIHSWSLPLIADPVTPDFLTLSSLDAFCWMGVGLRSSGCLKV